MTGAGPQQPGAALLAGGRFHEAHQFFSQALRDQPLSVEARVGLAQAFSGMGDGLSATAWLGNACLAAPQRAELWLDLVRALHAQQRRAEVEPVLATAIALHPEHAGLLEAQAEAYLLARQYPQALACYTRLQGLDPAHPTNLLHRGYCLEQTGALAQAVACYRDAQNHRPEFLEAHVNLAGVLWRLEDFQGSLDHARQAVALAPAHPYAVRILGTALLSLNRFQEAEQHLRRALELKPGFPLAEMDLALALLLSGRLEEGWRLYGRRWRDDARWTRPVFHQDATEWKGPQQQPVAGKRIAVYAEQGLGDVVQFIRYLRRLQADGGIPYCVVQPELVSLIEGNFAGVLCHTPQRSFEADFHVPLMDLPLHYGTTLDTIPSALPFLRAPEIKAQRWRERLAPWAGKFKVGICWSGSVRQANNRNRAFHLSDLQPLLDLPGVQCFSLQKGDPGDWTDRPADSQRLPDFTVPWNELSDSAAMIGHLDLVITVDTVIAHLAGALGLPVWVMLGPNADWRWLLDRDDSPWYPTMRLFRRGFDEDRTAQVARVAQALRQQL